MAVSRYAVCAGGYIIKKTLIILVLMFSCNVAWAGVRGDITCCVIHPEGEECNWGTGISLEVVVIPDLQKEIEQLKDKIATLEAASEYHAKVMRAIIIDDFARFEDRIVELEKKNDVRYKPDGQWHEGLKCWIMNMPAHK